MTFETLVDGIDFGEGPRWHQGKLWYSDFYQHTIYTVTLDGHREAVLEVPTQPSGLGWMPDGTLLIVSMLDRKLLAWDGQEVREHADLSGVATWHCNDMVVDAEGRAYVGNFGYDITNQDLEFVPATLAIVEPDGSVRAGPSNIMFPNGTVITPDGSTLILGETFGGKYQAFDIGSDGSLSNARVWASVEGHAPDGCTLDAAGGIWFADAVGQKVVRVVEGGEITHALDTGMGTYACTLGGDDGRTLFVLTAPDADPAVVAGQAGGAILTTTVEHPHAGRP